MENKLNELIILAGPKCVGKSTLIQNCFIQESGFILNHFSLNTKEWSSVNFNRSAEVLNTGNDNLILHYDFIAPIIKNTVFYKDDQLLRLINSAKKVHFITIWCPKYELISRLNNRIASSNDSKYVRRLNWVKWLYQTEGILNAVYLNWIKFINNIGSNHWLYLNSEHDTDLSTYNHDRFYCTVSPFI